MLQNFWQDVLKEIQNYYDILVAYTPRLILGLVAVLIFILVTRILKSILRKYLTRAEDTLMISFLGRLLEVVIFIIGLVLILNIMGWQRSASQLLAGAGLTAFILGFAFKDIGENFLAGILLAFKRPFKMGDIIESSGHRGKIVSINLREIAIKTGDGRDIFIPNGAVIKTPLINYTIDGFQRLSFFINLPRNKSYDDFRDRALQRLSTIPGILKKPKSPSVEILEITDTHYKLEVFFWVNTREPDVNNPRIRTKTFQLIREIV